MMVVLSRREIDVGSQCRFSGGGRDIVHANGLRGVCGHGPRYKSEQPGQSNTDHIYVVAQGREKTGYLGLKYGETLSNIDDNGQCAGLTCKQKGIHMIAGGRFLKARSCLTLLSAEPIAREEYCRENYSEDYEVNAVQGEQPCNSMLTEYKHHYGPERERVAIKQASRHSIRLAAIIKWTM